MLKRQLAFLVVTLTYWLLVMIGAFVTALGNCGMGPDSPADCNARDTSELATGLLLIISAIAYAFIAFAYFRPKQSGS